MSRYHNFMRICNRDFNLDSIVSIEIADSISKGSAVITVEYKNESITYPIVGTVEENRDKLDNAYRTLYTNTAFPIVWTGIERK
jgi:hypothetical protein